jgi:hypothetical protein
MSAPEVLAYVAAGAGGVSAVAGAVSARTNLSSVRRANLPFVYGEPAFGRAPGAYKTREEADNARITGVFVVLHNDGPGTAVEVRLRLRSTSGDWSSEATDAVRAIRPGETVERFGFQPPWEVDPDVRSWGVATRFQDTAGREWETFNQRYPAGPLTRRRLTGLRRRAVDW